MVGPKKLAFLPRINIPPRRKNILRGMSKIGGDFRNLSGSKIKFRKKKFF